MGNQNVQKAATKRARNMAKDEAKKGGHSIIGDKQQAANRTAFKCKTCLQTFAVTTKRAELSQHAETKHKKQVEECFENCPPAAA